MSLTKEEIKELVELIKDIEVYKIYTTTDLNRREVLEKKGSKRQILQVYKEVNKIYEVKQSG